MLVHKASIGQLIKVFCCRLSGNFDVVDDKLNAGVWVAE
jgi:hypothetical protein